MTIALASFCGAGCAGGEREHIGYARCSIRVKLLVRALLQRRRSLGHWVRRVQRVLDDHAFLLAGGPYHYNDLTLASSAGGRERRTLRQLRRALADRVDQGDHLVFAAARRLLPATVVGSHSLAMLIVGILLLDVASRGSR